MAGMELEHVTRLADSLSPSEKQRLIEHLSRQVRRAPTTATSSPERAGKVGAVWQSKFARSPETGATPADSPAGEAAPPARIAGLNAGEVWMSDDFDAELPDEFWFGEQ